MPRLTDRTLTELGDLARLVVRAAYLDAGAARAAVAEFVRAETGDPDRADRLADELVTAAEADLRAETATWPEWTDNDRLAAALTDLADRGYLVLEYCADHHDATAALRARPGVRGLVYFTDTDVWHAVTDRMLELKVWHADTSAVVAADPELADVLGALRSAGLAAVFDEGRVEVTLTWRRRPVGLRTPG